MLARNNEFPVLLHIRGEIKDNVCSKEAFEDAYEIIKDSGIKKGLLHCFTGDLEIAKKFLEIGFFISFSGNITFPFNRKHNLERYEKIIKSIPLNRILVETDSPYLSPIPRRGSTNFSENLIYVIKKISEIKGEDYSLIEKTVFKNSLDFFGISE
jgi:TatD DNase family protein